MKKLVAVCLTLALLCLATGFASAAPEKTASAEEAVAKTAMDVLSGIPDLPEPDSDQEADLIRDADEGLEIMRQYYLQQGYTEVSGTTLATTELLDEVGEETYRLAYQDLDSACPEMQEKILAARNEIIFHTSWRGDNSPGISGNVITKEFWVLPKFSDLFPGWDYPECLTSPAPEKEALPEEKNPSEGEPVPQLEGRANQVIRDFSTGAPLPVPSPTALTSDFCQIASVGDANTYNLVEVVVSSLSGCSKCNVGFRNIYYPQYQLHYESNMTQGSYTSTAQLKSSCPLFGIRASSGTNAAGSGSFYIRHSTVTV